MSSVCRWALCLAIAAASWTQQTQAEQLFPGLSVTAGPVNAVVIGEGKDSVAIYHADDAECGQLLLTNPRRDAIWPARLVPESCRIVAPESERSLIENS